jgi:alpha-glucosidase
MILKMKMKKTILLVLVLVGMNVWAKAQKVAQLESPDKSIVLNVFLSATG